MDTLSLELPHQSVLCAGSELNLPAVNGDAAQQEAVMTF